MIIKKMKEAPLLFTVTKDIYPVVINTTIDNITANLEKVKRGKINSFSALIVSRDIEQTILEGRIFKIIQSKDKNIKELLDFMNQDLINHNRMIQKMISERKSTV